MTIVEYGAGLEERVFGDLAKNGKVGSRANGSKYSTTCRSTPCRGTCSTQCTSHCTGSCENLEDSKNMEILLRPTLPKTTTNTPSLLETYVSTVGKEKVTPEERTLLTKLEGLDLDPIKVKLMDAEEGYGWAREQADAAANAYKQFLFINAKYDGCSIVPTKLVDKVWHYHILDTGKYAEDSQEIFGRFLHHFPYFGMRGEEDAENLKAAFEETLDLFMENFGSSQLGSFDEKAEDSNDSSEVGNCGGFGRCTGHCRDR